MADDLEAVEQKFIADVQPYIDAVEEAARDVHGFADANREAVSAVDDMRDHAEETAHALGSLRDDAEEAARADDSLRDSAYEAAEALGHERDEAFAAAAAAGIYADKVGNLHEANGRFVSSARKAELGLTGIKGGLEDLLREADKVESAGGGSGGGGLLQKILFGASGGVESAGAALPDILPVIAVILPAVGALLAEATALAGGFAAAGAGAGAFALLAVPAFDKVKGALKDTHAQLAKLDPDERGAVLGIRHLEDAVKSMSKAFEPEAFKVFNAGLKLANELLPLAKPFADTFANSLDGLLKQADKFASSKGFQDWVAQFHKLEGPSIHAIGEGVGHVASAIGKLLTTMSKKDVVNAINIAFSILSGTISLITFVVRRLMHGWDELSSGFHHSRVDAENWQHDVLKAFDRVRHDVADFAHNVSAHFGEVRHDVADLAHNISAHFDEIRHDVANLAHNIASYFDEARANIHRWAADVGSDATRVVGYFRALPARILAALASLPGRMMALGRAIIDGLLSGIKAAAGGVLSFVEGLGHDISSVFASAIRSLSPSRVFHDHGVNIVQGLINGIQAKKPELLALMRELGGQTGTGFAPAGGGSSAGTAPSVHVSVPVTLAAGAGGYNDPRFLQYLQGVVQEAVLRYTQVNPSNGLRLGGKLS